jgi:protein AATF/BFR2
LGKRSRNDIESWLSESIDQVLEPTSQILTPYSYQVIERWNAKVQVANSSNSSKFKVINQSIVSQLKGLEADKDRLMKRTRLNRSNVKMIGKEVNLK